MKKLFTCFVLCIFFLGCSTFHSTNVRKDVTYDPLAFQATLEAPGLSKEEIIKKVNKWAVMKYNSYKAVYQYSDESLIALNPIVSIDQNQDVALYYKINSNSINYDYQFRLEAKDGKARITIDSFKDTKDHFPKYTLQNEVNLIQNRNISNRWKRLLSENAANEDRQFQKYSARLFDNVQELLKSKQEEW
ncbi:MAG: hypothetical protein JWM28_4500 [Chitinophagaceae bacterium]|nr:hypothetical protein [Chitinophagaceae bacterium]